MLWPVMRKVAALTERGEIALTIVGRVMVEMRARQHHARDGKYALPGKLHHAQLPGQPIGR